MKLKGYVQLVLWDHNSSDCVPMWAVLFANPTHWRSRKHNSFFRLASSWVPIPSRFSSIGTCLFQVFFLSSSIHIDHNFVMILRIIALHDTMLSGCILLNFLLHFLHEEGCTKVSCMNNILFHFWTLWFTTLQTIFWNISRKTNHAKHQCYWDKPASIGLLNGSSEAGIG
jgi:hypothetical protein